MVILRRPGNLVLSRKMALLSNTYDNWTREGLVTRLLALDPHRNLPNPARPPPSSPPPRRPKSDTTDGTPKSHYFDDYLVRKIALKFCYTGSEYNGLAFQPEPTPLPTVEGVLFSALAQTWLVDPKAGFEGCGWERCGRTDRGVSAAGQVVSIWVRAGAKKCLSKVTNNANGSDNASRLDDVGDLAVPGDVLGDGYPPSSLVQHAQKPSERPLRYISMINRVLPPTIRVLAWSPVSPDFSARFACKYRHYKYFFTANGLDIALMREGARRLVGEHDFRNLCKLDPAKQITNFRRRILRAEINLVADTVDNLAAQNDVLYVLDLVGTAFLYHQVRHIMAVLFLVGSGLEHPSVVSALLNVSGTEASAPGDLALPVVDRKPEYQMADALPLVLWECGYAESDVQWRTDNGDGDIARGSAGVDVYRQLYSTYTRSVIQTALDAHFVQAAVAAGHSPPPTILPTSSLLMLPPRSDLGVTNIPLGGGTFRRMTKYVPLLMRGRLESVEVANERWRCGKGLRKEEKKKREGNAASLGDDE
jgi:tRNA pseudouridine38/39 synthase